MLNISFVGCKVDSESQKLNCADVGMRKEDQFHHIVHAVCISESVSDSALC